MDNRDASCTSKTSLTSKASLRSERSWEIVRTVTALKTGSCYEIESSADNVSGAAKLGELDQQNNCSNGVNKSNFSDVDAARFGLTKPHRSLSDTRAGTQLNTYIALGYDATLVSIDRLSQRMMTPQFGAVATFLGVTRRDRHPETGASTNRLVYEAYEQMAISELERVCLATQRRFGVSIAIAHRLGEVLLAEPSFACVCASPHRDAAFDAVRFAVSEVKSRVPIWKREYYENGASRWLSNSECVWSSCHSTLTPNDSAWNNLDTCTLRAETASLQSCCAPNVHLNLNSGNTAGASETPLARTNDADTSATSSLNGNCTGNSQNFVTSRPRIADVFGESMPSSVYL